jgi:hypothetical protein
VTIIGVYAFYDCTRLTSVTIPNSVTIIRSYAFYNCTDLSNVYFDSSGSLPFSNSTIINTSNVRAYYKKEVTTPDGSNNINDITSYLPTTLGFTYASISNKGSQSIVVDSSFNRTYGDSSFNLVASVSSGLPLSYSSDASNIATVSNTGQVTIVSVGETKINILQAGNAYYLDASASTILTVEASTPLAPTITGVIVDANDNDASNNTYSKIDVSFNVPSSNGGSNITNYEYSINDASFVTLTPIQVSSPLIIAYTFMADSSYNIKIRAVNEVGEGASSAIFNFNFSLPSSPIITKVTAKDRNATIYFKLPSNSSSQITKIELSRNGVTFEEASNVTISGTSGKIELTDLSEQGTYSFALRTSNGIGTGDASDPLQVSNICFPAGTLIETNQGKIAIEKIDPRIHTIRNKKICHITRTITQDKYLVCIEKNALGNNIPSEKTIISKNHCIWYNGKMVAAKELVNKLENVKKVKYQGDVLYNVLMEEADKMLVNNLICETLDPLNIIAKVYNLTSDNTKEEKRYIINKLNEYAIKNKIYK